MTSEETGATLELASRVYNTPLAIHPDILRFLGWCKLDMDDLAAWMAQGGEPPTPPAAVDHGGVAVIPIHGSLMRGTFFSDYDDIGDALDAAVSDASVSSILLDVDSPGGEVRGMFDLADRIYSARGAKPIVAHANDQMTSAAYALASSADEVVASPTASLGSIGVVAMHVDQSAAAEKAGLKMTEIASGAQKTALTPNRPLSDLGRAVLEKAVTSSADQFFDLVSRNRGLSVDAIRDQEAGIFFGQEAVDNGLADRVASRSEVLRELLNPIAVQGVELSTPLSANTSVPVTMAREEGSQPMADAIETTQVEEEIETPLAQVEEEIVTEEPTEDSNATDLEAAHAEGRAVAAQEAQEIIELCTLAGTPAAAAAFIAAGEIVSTVRARLLETKVIQGESNDINNSVDALASAGSPQVEIDPAAIYKARREVGRRS